MMDKETVLKLYDIHVAATRDMIEKIVPDDAELFWPDLKLTKRNASYSDATSQKIEADIEIEWDCQTKPV